MMKEENLILFSLLTFVLFIGNISELYGQDTLSLSKDMLAQKKDFSSSKHASKKIMIELEKKMPPIKNIPIGTYVGTIKGVTIHDLLAAGFKPLNKLYDTDHDEPALVTAIDYLDVPSFEPEIKFNTLNRESLNSLFCRKMGNCYIDTSVQFGSRAILGNESRESHFSYVRQIFTINKHNGTLQTCTGTFVSSYIMITAAHCLEKADARYGVLLKRVIPHRDRSKPTEWIESQSGLYQVHPGYFGLNGMESIPLNIAVIQWPIDLDSVRTSVKLMPYAHLPKQNEEVDAMGFSHIVWKKNISPNSFDGQLRSSSDNLIAISEYLVSVSGPACRSLDKFGHCQFNGHLSFASQGDAGGPLLPVTTSFYLIGILCCGEALPTQKISQAPNIAYYIPVWAPETRAFLKPALIKAGYDAELFPPGY